MTTRSQPERNHCQPCSKSKVIDQTASDVKEIKDALLGTDYQTGRLYQIDRHEKRIGRIEKVLWTASGVAIVVTFILKVLIK